MQRHFTYTWARQHRLTFLTRHLPSNARLQAIVILAGDSELETETPSGGTTELTRVKASHDSASRTALAVLSARFTLAI